MSVRYCPECGAAVEARPVHDRVRPVCTACGFIHYEHSRPCVGVLAVEQGKVLLVERAIEPFRGYWDIPGGFLEAGEHPAAGAAREMLEETGLEIETTEILGLFMDVYGDAGIATLSICYLARVTGGELRAGDDAAGLQWHPLGRLPEDIAFSWERGAIEELRRRENDVRR
jgi:ADP-ribose pyrophosphatase YjhB (NUDIX family)